MDEFMLMMIPELFQSQSFSICSMGYEQTSPTKKKGPIIRDRYCIHFVFDGRGTFCGEPIKRGDCFLYCPNITHSYQSDPEAPLRYGWIDFFGEYAEAMLEKAGIELRNHVFEYEYPDVIEQYFSHFCNESFERMYRADYLAGCFYILLSFLIKSNERKKQVVDIKKHHVKMAVDYMERNYHRAVTVDEIASVSSISSHHLSNIFKEELKISPRSYLTSLRMNRAAELLSLGNLMITDIAHSVSYADPLVFSKQFKKYFGLSPSQYRENAKQSKESSPHN